MPTQGNFLVSLLIIVFGFFFVTVSSRITGLIGSSSNPISGMTIATLILTCSIFVALGWTGDYYSPVAICVGAIVCIASANAGGTSQDLKTGYIVGATPRYQQIGLIIGVLTSALVIGMTTLYLHRVMGIGSTSLPAPQATLMATIIKGLLSQNLPWGLVLVGVFITVTLELCGIHSLSFAVGSYLPIATTAPIFAGGLVRAYVEKRTGRAEESEVGAGTLFSSGLIAGGSLAGILYAVLFGRNLIEEADASTGIIPAIHEGTMGNIVGALVFIALAVVLAQGRPEEGDVTTRRSTRTPQNAQSRNALRFPRVLRLMSSLLALSLAASAEAQTTTRRATNLGALLAFPGFYHGRPIVVVGKVALEANGQLKVSDDDGSIPIVFKGNAPDGTRRSPRRVLGHRPHEGRRHQAEHLRPARHLQGEPRRSVAAPGRGHGDHRHRDHTRRDSAGGDHPQHRPQPRAIRRSEGGDYRAVFRTQPARRPAGCAGEEPLRLRACARPMRRCGSSTCGRS